MRGPLPLALAFVLVLAGCAAPAEVAPAATLAADPLPVVEALEYVCPPGGEPRGALCVTTLADTLTSLQEPFLAIDPYRAGVMAIGVNAGHTVGAVDPMRAKPGLDLILLDIYVTEDAGATWRLSQIPYVPSPSTLPLEYGGSGDPAIAFDAAGVMHVSGIINLDLALRGYEIFYTSSPDLGKTWTAPVTFTDDGDNDRNWINVGPDGAVYVPWQNVGDSTEVVVSRDGGLTWSAPAKADDCITVSPMLFADATPLLTCATIDDDELTGVAVFELDPVANALVERSRIEAESTVWPQMRALPDGRIVLTYEDYAEATATSKLRLSSDQGRTWSEAIDIHDVFTSIEGADATLLWSEVSPEGDLHTIVLASSPGALPMTSQRKVVHAALDLDTLAVIAQTELPTGGDGPAPRTLGPSYGDHYYGLAFDAEGGHLVWTDAGALDIGAFVPVVS